MSNKETVLNMPRNDIMAIVSGLRAGEKPIDSQYANQLTDQLAAVNHYGKQLQVLSDRDLHTRRVELQQVLKSSPDNEQATLEFMALVREYAHRTKEVGLFAHPVQVLTVLNVLNQKGRLQSQVKTGEGKSLISVMQAAMFAAKGHEVDIMTSDSTLARRDQQRFHQFFRKLGFTSGLGTFERYEDIVSNMSVNSNADDHKSHAFTAQIVFGSLYDMMHATQRDQVLGYGILGNRRRDVLLLDEADYLELDDGTRCIISSPFEQPVYPWLYKGINALIDKQDFNQIPQDEWPELVRSGLQRQPTAQSHIIRSFDDSELKQWVRSSMSAKNSREGVDFIVMERSKTYLERMVDSWQGDNSTRVTEAVVVDKATGELKQNTQWSEGVHQFLQARLQDRYNNVKITPERQNISSEAPRQFIRSYGKYSAMTGTAGIKEEMEEVERRFGAPTFVIPPNVPSKRRDVPLTVTDNQTSHYKRLVEEITLCRTQGRPILVAFDSIRAEQAFADYLEQRAGIPFQELNGLQLSNADEEQVLSHAGLPGMVTLATQKAGRGVDILPTKEALTAGGLHVVVTFVPNSPRMEQQIKGRTARQGAPGSATMILNREAERIPANRDPQQFIDEKQLRYTRRSAAHNAYTETTRDALEDRFDGQFKSMCKEYFTRINQHTGGDTSNDTMKEAREKARQAYRLWGNFYGGIMRMGDDVLESENTQGETVEDKMAKINKEADQLWTKAKPKIEEAFRNAHRDFTVSHQPQPNPQTRQPPVPQRPMPQSPAPYSGGGRPSPSSAGGYSSGNGSRSGAPAGGNAGNWVAGISAAVGLSGLLLSDKIGQDDKTATREEQKNRVAFKQAAKVVCGTVIALSAGYFIDKFANKGQLMDKIQRGIGR